MPVYLRNKKFEKKFSRIQKTTYLYRRCEVIMRKMWEEFGEYCKYIFETHSKKILRTFKKRKGQGLVSYLTEIFWKSEWKS